MHQHKLITLAAYSVWIITINPSIAYSRSINKIRNLIGANNTFTRPNLRIHKTLSINMEIIFAMHFNINITNNNKIKILSLR